ncbi:unnamed protein product, partial [Sphagnum compactum]
RNMFWVEKNSKINQEERQQQEYIQNMTSEEEEEITYDQISSHSEKTSTVTHEEFTDHFLDKPKQELLNQIQDPIVSNIITEQELFKKSISQS